jgi:hypothetical protein
MHSWKLEDIKSIATDRQPRRASGIKKAREPCGCGLNPSLGGWRRRFHYRTWNGAAQYVKIRYDYDAMKESPQSFIDANSSLFTLFGKNVLTIFKDDLCKVD